MFGRFIFVSTLIMVKPWFRRSFWEKEGNHLKLPVHLFLSSKRAYFLLRLPHFQEARHQKERQSWCERDLPGQNWVTIEIGWNFYWLHAFWVCSEAHVRYPRKHPWLPLLHLLDHDRPDHHVLHSRLLVLDLVYANPRRDHEEHLHFVLHAAKVLWRIS